MRRILPLLIVALQSLSLKAANEEFSISYLGVESGLSNNHVVGITQDKFGYIWIATDEGLNRFDGYRVKSYYKDESGMHPSLAGNELNGILDDPIRPVIWVATQRAGLNAYNYDTGEFKSYRHSWDDGNTLATDDVTSVTPAADGGLWIATFSNGFDHLDPDTGKFTHYNSENVDGLPGASIWSIVEGSDGFIYLAHEFSGFTVVDVDNRTARNYRASLQDNNGLPTSSLNCVYKDSLDNLWLGTDRGPVLYNHEEDTFTNFADFHPNLRYSVGDIKQFSGNRLWVAMERGGIAVLDISDKIFSHPEESTCVTIGSGLGRPSLSSPSVRCLYQDDFSNVWAGSWGGGVNIISPHAPAFRQHPAYEPSRMGEVLSANSVLSVAVDNDNRLWVGKDGGELVVYEGDKFVRSFSKEKGTLPGSIVQTIHKTPDGDMWLGFFNEGACRYDMATGRFETVIPSSSRIDVRDIVSEADGDVLFATTGGVWRYDAGSKTVSGPYPVGNNLVRCIYPFDGGTYLIGTFGAGFIMTDHDFNELRRYDVMSGIPSNTVNDIFRTRDNRILVATGEGLVIYPDLKSEPDNYEIINRASGLCNTHILAITQDRSGCIWLSTNGGISCIKGDRIYNYTHRDHVPIGNFFGGSVASDRQGNLYFGAISGLCMFNPVRVLDKIETPSPVIVGLSMLRTSGSGDDIPDDIEVGNRTEIKLNPGQNSFEILFASRNLALAPEVEYAYMLEGNVDKWIMARDNNAAVFRDLSPGNYVFRVKCRVRNQEWGDPVELKIILPPPFWLSLWAKIIYFLVAVAVIVALLYFYRKRVNAEAMLKSEQERHLKEQELNDERLRFYTNVTHELRTPLTLIMGPVEDLARNSNLPDKEKRSIGMVHRNAERLLDLVNRILEFRKTETQNRRLCVRRGNIASTVFEVALKYKELNRNPKVKVEVSTEEGDIQMIYDKEVITIVLDNLISNALKYTKEGKVSVVCRREEESVVLGVSDTGVGISPEAIANIFDRYYQEKGPHQAAGTGIGLALVKNLVALHHGEISVTSGEGKGTEFIVRLPLSEVYPEALHMVENLNAKNDADEHPVAQHPEGERKPLILVVEDNEDIREYIHQSFTDLYDVRSAVNGKEGLEMAFEIMPSLVVSDIMMPEMDGIEMTRRLKEDMRTSHIPVILLTAKESEADRQVGYESGADSYLVKPFSSTMLQSRINNILHQRMKLIDTFSGRPSPVQSAEGESIASKRSRLMKSLNDVDREFIEKLNKVISDNIPGENVDVNFIAGTMCMSTSTLYRKVKALTGISPNEYIRKTKMQMAEDLLLDGHYTFSEIAFKVGINSVAYFRQCFKDEFGMTPSEYLNSLKE